MTAPITRGRKHRIAGHEKPGKSRCHRPCGQANQHRDSRDHRALARLDDREYVGLARRYVHLDKPFAQQKQHGGHGEARRERHRHEQEARRDVSEHHRVHEPDPPSKPRGTQVRHRVEESRAEEQRSDHGLRHAEPLEEEERQHRGGQKPAGETVDREQRRDPHDDRAAARRQASAGAGRRDRARARSGCRSRSQRCRMLHTPAASLDAARHRRATSSGPAMPVRPQRAHRARDRGRGPWCSAR